MAEPRLLAAGGRGWSRRTVQARFCLLLAAGFALLATRAAAAEDRDNCLYCHQYSGMSRFDPATQRVRLFFIDPAYMLHAQGPHARLACTDCHAREEVGVVPHREITPVDCARQCHLVRPDGPERRFSHEGIVRMLDQGAHTRAALAELEFTGGPLLGPNQSICLYCHDEPMFRSHSGPPDGHARSGVARCEVCHATQVPLDTQYFQRHVVARGHPARSTLELAQVCAVCHSDPKFLAQREQPDPVASYVRSFHGKAALLGDESTASCLDCHLRPGQNPHLLVGQQHPESAVHVSRVADSCRSTDCHPGADKSIASTAVHLDLPTARGTIDFLIAAAFIVITIVSFGPSALIVLLELTQVVIGRHDHRLEPLRQLAETIYGQPGGRARLKRFTRPQRIQHWVLTLLFVLLVLTGFPMKFADQAWSAVAVGLFGGLGTARVVHHWAGIALLVGFALHLLAIVPDILRGARALAGRINPGSLLGAILRLPLSLHPSDLQRVGHLFGYLLGLRRQRPLFGRFSASEKFEYFGVLWGTTLLGLTGLLLWGEQLTTRWLGGRALNIASIIHTYEAFLAVIHVGILHIHSVMLAPTVFPLSRATLTGHAPAAKLAHENGGFVLETAREMNLPLPPELADLEGTHA